MSQTLRKDKGGGLLDQLLLTGSRVLPRRVLVRAVKRGPLAYRLEVRDQLSPVGRMDYEPHDIFLHVDSMVEHSVRLNSCKKEPDTVRWIETFLRPGDVLFDVGANVGAYSLVAAKFHGGRVRAYAFEPAFVNYSQLCRNIVLNGCEESVVALPVALSERTTIDRFNCRDLIPGSAMHAFGEAVDDTGESFEPGASQYVMSYRVDDLIRHFSLPAPNHLKVDVDGIEFQVLAGARETLAGPSVRSIIIELREDENGRRIAELLRGHGFELHSKHERWTAGLFNFVFQRPAA